jgi:hypothetical protein
MPNPQVPITGPIGAGGNFPIMGYQSVEITGNADLTLSFSQYSTRYIQVTSDGLSTGVRKVYVPAIAGAEWTFEDATFEGFGILVVVVGNVGSGINIDGLALRVAVNGAATDVELTSPNTSASTTNGGVTSFFYQVGQSTINDGSSPAAHTLYALGDETDSLGPIQSNECVWMTAVVTVNVLGAGQGGSFTRVSEVQSLDGVITNLLTGGTGAGNLDFDQSVPAPNANINAALVGMSATITETGGNIVLDVTPPTDVAIAVRAQIYVERCLSPTVALSIAPNTAATTVSRSAVIDGSFSQPATAVFLCGIAATIVSQNNEQIVIDTGTAGAVAGTGNVVVQFASGPPAIIVGGFTYTNGIIPALSIAAANTTVPLTGTNAQIGTVPVTGSGFTGATFRFQGPGGAVAIPSVVVHSDSSATLTLPATTSSFQGLGNLIATNTGGDSATSSANAFFYLPANLYFWTRTDLAPQSGGVLTGWPDLSGNDASYIASTPPQVVTANGQDAATVGSGISFPSWSVGPFTGTEFTTWYVGVRTVVAYPPGSVMAFQSASSPNGPALDTFSMVLQDAAAASPGPITFQLSRNTGGSPACTLQAPSGQPTTTEGFVASGRFDGTNAYLRFQGVEVQSLFAHTAMDANRVVCGADINASVGGLEGGSINNVNELMVFSAAQDPTDVACMATYWNWRYGLTG